MTSPRPSGRQETRGAGCETGADWVPPAGWRVLVPGLPQWSWGQGARGWVLFGSCASGLATAAFLWGTPTSLGLLVFAFLAHVVSVVDAWDQAAFPPLGRWAPGLTAAVWLAAVLYAPALVASSLLGWPGLRGGGSATEGYLIDRWAYRSAEPRPGDWVWFRPTHRSEPRLGRVVAGSSHEVEWSDNMLRVEGRPAPIATPFRPAEVPRSLTYRVSDGHVLVKPARGGPGDGGLVILERD
jgi:hypothetical protein